MLAIKETESKLCKNRGDKMQLMDCIDQLKKHLRNLKSRKPNYPTAKVALEDSIRELEQIIKLAESSKIER